MKIFDESFFIRETFHSDTNDCPAGHYSVDGQCVPCAAGTYKSSTSAGICLVCNAGRYCDKEGLVSPTGYCQAGYYCPAGSTSATAVLCPENFYCIARAGSPTPCYSGRFSYAGSTASSACATTGKTKLFNEPRFFFLRELIMKQKAILVE